MSESLTKRLFSYVQDPRVAGPLALGLLLLVVSLPTQLLWLQITGAVLAVGAVGTNVWLVQRALSLPALPAPESPGFAKKLGEDVSETQQRALRLMGQGKYDLALELTRRNLARIDREIAGNPDDAHLRLLKGYTLKDIYQSTLGRVPARQRDQRLIEAETIFRDLLTENPDNVGALNGLGNVLFFWGQFDEAIEVFDRAAALSTPDYLRTIEHDRSLATRYREGKARPGTIGEPARA